MTGEFRDADIGWTLSTASPEFPFAAFVPDVNSDPRQLASWIAACAAAGNSTRTK